MFDFGFWEIVVIAILALLVLGPERLPVVASKVGYWVGRGRRYLASVRSDIEREFRTEELERMLNQQSSEIKELKNMISETQKEAISAVEESEYLVKARPDAEKDPSPDKEGKPRIASDRTSSDHDSSPEKP